MSGKVRATERLYLTAGKDRLVRHGDPAAAFLYCGVGRQVPEDEARKLGFFDLDAHPEPSADPDPEPEPEAVVAPEVKRNKGGRPKGSKNKPQAV